MIAGKGVYIWNIPNCEGGTPQAIASRGKSAGLGHVIVKVCDGPAFFNGQRGLTTDLVPSVVDALKQAGLDVWGYQYVYGKDPVREAEIAITRSNLLGLDGFVIDAESEYKTAGATAARAYMSRLRTGLKIPITLASYRYPKSHPDFPWAAFLEQCDFNMPQVYWEGAHNPAQQLQWSYDQFANAAYVGVVKPMLAATGAAYANPGLKPPWVSTAADITEFLTKAKAMGLQGASLWSWEHLSQLGLWEAVGSFDWPTPEPEPTPMPQTGMLWATDAQGTTWQFKPPLTVDVEPPKR